MPDVRMPDGTIIKNVPEGTTRAELERKYSVKSGRTGKSYGFDVPEGGDPIEAAQTALRAQEPETVERPVYADSGTTAPPSALEAFGGTVKDFATNFSTGMASFPDAISEYIGQPVNEAFKGAANFMLTGGGASPHGADWTGNALAPREAPTIRGVNNALNPGAYDRSNTGFLTEMLGAALLPIGPKGAPARISAPVAATAGKAASKAIVPYADEIVAAGAREKVPVLTTDIKPPRTMMGKAARNLGERLWLVGTGGKRAGQNQARIDAATRLVEDFGGGDDALAGVTADLAKTRGDQLSRLSGIKTSLIEGIGGKVPTPAASKAINEQIVRLRGINADAFKPVIDKLLSFEETLESGKTLAQIEGNRKLLGDLFADPSLAAIKGDGQKALNAIYGPLRDDMGAFIEQAAGKGARAKWQGANDRLAAMAGELKSSAFKKVLNDAETTPEGAAKLIFSKTPSEVNRLFVNLSPAGKVKARAAVMFKAAEGSTENGIISPEKFSSALKAMQTSTRGLFDPADAARIEGMVRLLKGTKRASEAGVMTKSGQELAPLATVGTIGAVASKAPILLPATLLPRLYESAPVRDLLLRLGRAKPGTPGYRITWDRLNTAIAKIAPVAANDAEGALAASPGRAAATADDEQN